MVIVGDINVDFLTISHNHILNQIMLEMDLTNVINEPTRHGLTRHSLLDPILLSDNSRCTDSHVIKIDRNISDHDGCVVFLSIPISLSRNYTRQVWSYKNADFNKLNNLINTFDWETFFQNFDSVDIASVRFTEQFLSYASECIPKKSVVIRPQDKLWMNSELRKAMRLRDRLRKVFKRVKSISNLTKYKQQRNKVNNMKKHARELFYDKVGDIIDKLDTSNPKSYWRLVRKLYKQSESLEVIPPLTNPDSGNIELGDIEKANILNNYFCSISTINDREVPLPNFNLRTNSFLDSVVVRSDEVCDILKILKLGKASGHDTISHHMLKFTANSICKPLSILFNMSFNQKSFPEIWKKGVVLPLFKKGDRHLVSNYRPITLLSCIGKVFERVVFKHIYNYFHENSLFYEKQSGFMSCHSTVHQLIEIYHNICCSLEEKKHACLIFCDISKAFDRVWHKGLLIKLEAYGIRGDLLEWLKNYISDRQQQVIVKNVYSNTGYTTAGVPQGSVLGPLLFLIYINDIVDNMNSISRLFADDTSLMYSSSSLLDIQRSLNNDLQKLNKWSQDWLTKFNPQKTDVLLITNSKNIPPLNLTFGEETLKLVGNHRHLGVTFSSDAKWSLHIAEIIKTCMKKVSVLRKFKFLLSRKTLLRIYRVFVLPVLEYACEVWDGCSLADVNKLEQVQLEAARIITGMPSFSSKQSLYKESQLQPLSERRKFRKLSMMYKLHNDLTPSYFSNLLPPRVGERNSYNVRNKENYTVPNFRLSTSYESFIPSSVRLWNNLPIDVREQPSISRFKSKIENNRDILPIYYLTGNRKLNVLHTRLRHVCSSLNYDLYRVNIINDTTCACGNECENVYHYFFDCILYRRERETLFDNLSRYCNVTLNVILWGSPKLSDEQNGYIFQYVQNFIKSSNRF
ncbi:hypothetical protein CI610_03355 [invertebrate metagenome]|uniref:Reverse transcriptase domain-containing protein n=1 Tax=invertebrate metagenome TaxID=1711999 RepID=A0A2H9T3F5_9ZZZZ